MKIWLSKNSEVPVREQLITQITLGIASGDLPIGKKLPSTREIAYRFNIHSNTVSNAYQILAEQGLLEFRQGSGFYVSEARLEKIENTLDQTIAEFIQKAQRQGFTLTEIRSRLLRFLDINPADRLIVVEDDEPLREILVEEIREAANFQVSGTNFDDFRQNLTESDAVFVAMFDEKARIQAVLPPNRTCYFLRARSAAASMKGETRPTPDDLIAVVSGWNNFLAMARTILIAANIEPESLIVRSTAKADWQKGLASASMVICDSLTARRLSGRRVRVFRLISDDSLRDLREICERKAAL